MKQRLLINAGIGVENLFNQMNRKRLKMRKALLQLHFLLFELYMSYHILLKHVRLKVESRHLHPGSYT